MSAVRPGLPTFAALPRIARAYVAVVVTAGALCLLDAATKLQFERTGLFLLLLVLGVATSAVKIDLPLGRSQSNLSLSHAINFWALFALRPAEAVCIATVTAWLAGAPIAFLMESGPSGFAALARTAAVIAPLYFFTNTALVAAAIGLSTRQPVSRVWHRN